MSARSSSPMPCMRTGSNRAMLLRRHGRRCGALAPDIEQRVESRGSHVVMIFEVVLQAGRAIARRQTLDLFIVELAIRRALEVADAEPALDVLLEVHGA